MMNFQEQIIPTSKLSLVPTQTPWLITP